MRFTPGARLGPYTIVAPLGAGGMGEVYRAKDPRIGREVAIKVLPESFAKDPEGLARFEHEARAAGMLNHPNLLTIFDVGHADESYYMVSELLTGETLRELTHRQPIPRRKVIQYALQIASGLAAAHDKGIVHRDLKPENIFVTMDERVKILDFGLAKVQAGLGKDLTGALKTEPGIVLGTVGYMSPEQVRGEQLDQRSDIFSFGAILFEMLTNQRAFKKDSPVETLSAILKEDPIDIPEITGRIPAPLERVVRRCLEKKKDLRFQSARDLAFHLESIPPTTLTGVALPQSPSKEAPVHSPQSSQDLPTATLPELERSENRSTRSSIPTSGSVVPTPTSRSRAHTYPTTRTPQKPPRRGPHPALLLTAALLLFGAGAAVVYMLQNRLAPRKVPSFQRLTFRRGEVLSARFSPDGGTILYSAAWDGAPPEIYMMRSESPEAKPLGVTNADLADISSTGEAALLLDIDRQTGLGRLARVPIMGGTPREVLENVLHAEWMPDGELAVIHVFNGKYRLEVPIGNIILDGARPIRLLKISPDGSRVAFVQPNRGQFEIVMFEDEQAEVLTTGWSHGVTGLAWSPDGAKLWFTATDSGSDPPSLYSVKPGEEPRLASRLTGSLGIEDVAPDGRLLFQHTTWQASLMFHSADGTERDLAWLDWSTLRDMSSDGSTVLFSETRQGGGESGAIYLRATDGSPPLHVGEGFGDAISPDGRWILAHQSPIRLARIPTGTGEPEVIETIDSFDVGVRWFPDGERILIAGADEGSAYRLFVQNLTTNEIRPITPEGIWGASLEAYSISPDGRHVAGMNDTRRLTIYSVDSNRSTVVASAEPEEIPIGWTEDGSAVLIHRLTDIPARVYRVDLATGERALWLEIAPDDPAGVNRISPIRISSDGTMWSWNVLRTLSNLYVAEGID